MRFQGPAVTIRTYFWLLLGGIALAPLVGLGFLTMQRAEHAASVEVQAGTSRLATVVGDRLGAYVDSERRLLRTIGSAGLQAPAPQQARGWLEASMLDHPHLQHISLHTADGTLVAGEDIPERVDLVRRAGLNSTRVQAASPVIGAPRRAGFAHSSLWVEPVTVVGKPAGVIVAKVDLVGLWPAVNAVRVGSTGFVRLLSGEGVLLAHGNPEERRYVFGNDRKAQATADVQQLTAGVRRNEQGIPVVTATAGVPGTNWKVVVEQEVTEALRGTKRMKRDLGLLAAGAVLFVLVIGTLLGRRLVREFERLRNHAERLARGELDARITPNTRLAELRTLATSLNAMGGSLATLQEQARNRERMATLARVAAGLAHDIRQPIETVRAVCAQLTDNPDDAATRERFHRITQRELPKLGDYVGDLQRMARGEDEQIRTEPIDLLELCKHVVEELAGSPKWRGVRFDATGEPIELHGDRRLLHRAVVNLAANGADACVEHSSEGEVHLRVAARGEGAQAEITVKDSGVGIPKERIAGLLEGDFETTKRSTGIGLGLGIVRHVAEVHRGQLRIDSSPGQGTTFSLILDHSQPAAEA